VIQGSFHLVNFLKLYTTNGRNVCNSVDSTSDSGFSFLLKNYKIDLAVMAHACNSSYSEDRDQEDHGLKPAQAHSLQDPTLKTILKEKELVEWLKV
jgi:hypothetical protein